MNTEKHQGFYKKYDWLIWTGIVLIIIFFAGVYEYVSIKRNPRYAIGETRKVTLSKGIKRETKYEFSVDGNRFRGTYVELSFNAKEIVVPDGKYLVLYSASNPELNQLLVDKPILDNIDIDSVNLVGFNEEDLSWFY
ncbi:MAG: hypothetical protein ACI9CQ_003646 [Saprospiraceae bacterium]|jgi:hypothetical protein